MKTLIIGFLLMLSSVFAHSQTYLCDSIANFKHLEDRTFTTVAEDMLIEVKGNKVSFTGSYKFTAIFIDTLDMNARYPGRLTTTFDTFIIRSVEDINDERYMNIIYEFGIPASVGVLDRNKKLTVFHIKFVLSDGTP